MRRRGRGGIEPHLERQTTASPKSQGSRDEREREREAACAPLGEQVLSLAACSCFITGLVVEYGSPIASIPNQDHKRTTTLTLL